MSSLFAAETFEASHGNAAAVMALVRTGRAGDAPRPRETQPALFEANALRVVEPTTQRLFLAKAFDREIDPYQKGVPTTTVDEFTALKLPFEARIFIGSASEPYPEVEADLSLTREILETLARHPSAPSVVLQTKSPLILRDIDVLKRFARLRVNVPINTDSDAVRKQYEPEAGTIARRLATVRELHEAGIETCICLTPLLFVANPSRFAEQLRASGANSVVAQRIADGKVDLSTQRKLESTYRRTVRVLAGRLPNFRPLREGFSPAGTA